MTKGTIKFEGTGTGFRIMNGGDDEGTDNVFNFLNGLQKRGLFQTISNGPYHRNNWLPDHRMAKFIGYATRCGFKVKHA